MHRVLSFQMGRVSGSRGFGESSEFVTKRMCFSFIFFIGFLALLGGFLLGRMSTERNIEIRKERERIELANDALKVTERPKIQYNLLLDELRNITSFQQFQHFTAYRKNYETDRNEDAYRIGSESLKNILSNSGLDPEILEQRSSIVATVRGSQEPDRWIILSVNGNGTMLALELVKIFGKLKMDHNWEPKRTIKFCFFEEPDDPCRDSFSKYFKSRIVAYIAVHGKAIKKKGCLVASGSDIIKSIVLDTIEESISALDSRDNAIFDSCKIGDDIERQILVPRIASDIPHASLSFENGNSTSSEFSSETEMLPYRKVLTQIIARSVWKLSDDIFLKWYPKDFERDVKAALKMLNSSDFSEVEEQILSTTSKLVEGGESLNWRINSTINSSSLDSRMKNDLLMNLDRALLCPDINSRSTTDFSLIPRLLSVNSHLEATSSFLSNILKCYNEAVEILREG